MENVKKNVKMLLWMMVVVINILCNTLVASAAYKISDGDVKCTKDNTTYEVTGTTSKNRIYVKGKNIKLYLNNVTIDLLNENDDEKSKEKSAIHIEGGSSVTIYLKGTNRLEGGNNTGIGKNYGYAGICVEDGATLTILGSGSLTVKGGGVQYGAAAIGSNYDENCGKIIIGNSSNCPTVNATGGYSGAGIGSGRDGICDDGIYIYNGKITATGGKYAAGIGGGDAIGTGSGGNCSNINISGGSVTAKGGTYSAGIGGSEDGDVSDITITGGYVTATGGTEGAGIGGGKEGFAKNITIRGGNVTATGGKYAAGIGGGNRVNGGNGGDVDNINITGGTITAKGGESAAGIGGGDQSNVTNLKIQQSSASALMITATGGKYGAGIGNGNSGAIKRDIGSIYIYLRGGTIKATGGSGGAGIGGGNSMCESIKIYGWGTITATGYDESCGIGAGDSKKGGTIYIEGKANSRSIVIKANALANQGRTNDAAAIGGADCEGGAVTIKNATVTVDSRYDSDGAGIGGGYKRGMIVKSTGDITIENCKIADIGKSTRRGASIGTGWSGSINKIIIKNSDIDVGNIGTAFNGNEVFRETCIELIEITNSNVKAYNSEGQKAAIGTGAYASIKKIKIDNSTIDAYTKNGAGIGSGGYNYDSESDYMLMTGGECGEIIINNSKIKATGGCGGAGIGGGWGTSVGMVKIYNSEVEATGGKVGKGDQGGAGIGGGTHESCGPVIIESSTVVAKGNGTAAGIGSNGSSSITSILFNTTCNGIVIKKSTVTAQGGKCSAGIGTGYGAQFTDGAYITIEDSTVNATGGDYGAGIGAGSGASLDRGGEASIEITIKGRTKVEARGGIGAAGIGGGFEGGADKVKINLADTAMMTNDNWLYYVKAYGGKGAAGIGSGAVNTDNVTFPKEGYDIDSVEIANGYVYAKGGDRDDKLGKGAGAGIGGGARGGNINGFYVSGGFVEAHAGSGTGDFAADDIGTGGNDVSLYKDENFYITGGTVLGKLSSDPKKIYIDGGSVKDNVSNAYRTNGTRVYRTLMNVGYPYYYVENLKTSVDGYGCESIISDDTSKVYLYLAKTGTDGGTADFYSLGKSKHYYGTVGTNGYSWLKMDAKLEIILLDTPVAGKTFRAKVTDNNVSGNIEYTVSGAASLEDGSNTVLLSKDEALVLKGDRFGVFVINAITTEQSEMYWNGEGTYEGKISKSVATVTVVTEPSKIYDGKPVSNPGVTTNSNGPITYTYYNGAVIEANKLSGPPTEASNYTVIVKVGGTNSYEACEVRKNFNIEQRPVSLAMSASGDGTTARIEVEVVNAVTADGKVDFDIVKDGGGFVSQEVPVIKDSDGKYKAILEFDKVTSSDYRVTAQYIRGTNHYCRESITKTFSKNKALRTVTAPDIEVVYGASPFTINPSKSASSTEGDYYTYKIVEGSDELASYGLQPTVILDENTGEVEFNRAGKAVIEVTLKEKDDLGNGVEYEDAVTYVTVTVKRKEITAQVLVHDGNHNQVESVVYGNADELQYEIMYSGLVGAEVFEDTAVGKLVVEQLDNTAEVGINEINIKEVGGTISLNGTVYENIFISRNYIVKKSPAYIDVKPASIKIAPVDTTSTYGEEEQVYKYEVIGIKDWDEIGDVFENEPVIGLDNNVVNASLYTEINPGTYEDAIVVKDEGTIKINSKGKRNYVIEATDSADLIIDKADIRVGVNSEIVVYNGNPVDIVAEVASQLDTAYDGEVAVKYYLITGEGLESLEGAPVNVGIYLATATGTETAYYHGASSSSMIVIDKAMPEYEIPQLPDMKMHDGLVLSEQMLPEGWTWYYPDTELSVGYVSGLAMFTPEDTHNYKTVEAYLDFNVYDETLDIPDEDKDDGNETDEESEKEDADSKEESDDDDDSDDDDSDDDDLDDENSDDDSDDKDSDDEDSDSESPDDDLDDDSDGEEEMDEDVVDTGDTFNPVIWLCVFGVSGSILVWSIINHFKGKK